ncbi:DinB family protein [Brevibacillus fluminis]|uniref:DinB family protein n=1 Tax=Brevibacillus fluminis TaxID=511487 RepID=UPI003F8A892D
MNKKETLKLYDYHVWANRKTFDHAKGLPAGLYHEQLQSVFPTLYDAVAHIYIVDNVWLRAVSGKSYEETVSEMPGVMEEVKGKSLGEMEQLYGSLAERFRTFLMEKEDYASTNSYTHPAFGTLHATPFEIVQHVVNHGTYHRGNLTAMMRQLGQKGASTDYIYYLYEIR